MMTLIEIRVDAVNLATLYTHYDTATSISKYRYYATYLLYDRIIARYASASSSVA